MNALQDAETKAGRMLTRNEILNIVAENMREYRDPDDLRLGEKTMTDGQCLARQLACPPV